MNNDNKNGELKHKENFKRSKTIICKWSMFNVKTINHAIILESFEIKQWPLNLVIVQISILTQLNLWLWKVWWCNVHGKLLFTFEPYKVE
jgi:hypothetical protein